eukprot:4141831-Pyramimonas_sp.AAC.1
MGACLCKGPSGFIPQSEFAFVGVLAESYGRVRCIEDFGGPPRCPGAQELRRRFRRPARVPGCPGVWVPGPPGVS